MGGMARMYLISISTVQINAEMMESVWRFPVKAFHFGQCNFFACLCYLVSLLQYQNAILDAYDLSTEWGIWCFITCYIGGFELVDDHRAGKLVVELNGRLNWCGMVSPVIKSVWLSLKRGLHDFFLHVRCVSLSCQPCLGIGTVCPTSMGHVQSWPFATLHTN